MNSALLLKTRISIAACPENLGPTARSYRWLQLVVCPIAPPNRGQAWLARNHNHRQKPRQPKLPMVIIILRVVFTKLALYRIKYGIQDQIHWIQFTFHDPLELLSDHLAIASTSSSEYPPLIFHLNHNQLETAIEFGPPYPRIQLVFSADLFS